MITLATIALLLAVVISGKNNSVVRFAGTLTQIPIVKTVTRWTFNGGKP